MGNGAIAYHSIIMRCDRLDPTALRPLAPPLRLAHYRAGDERHWADIHLSLGEFARREEACAYFCRTFLKKPLEAQERCLFLLDGAGEYLATCSAWYAAKGEGVVPIVHWLAVREGYGGRGYARLALSRACEKLAALHGEAPIYLNTQPSSYKAIKLYLDFGFRMARRDTFAGKPNDYAAAMGELHKHMEPAVFRRLAGTAVP